VSGYFACSRNRHLAASLALNQRDCLPEFETMFPLALQQCRNSVVH
jgi:hypothetical protein